MQIKTVKVTNPCNVVLQIPGFVASKWGVQRDDELEVHYDEETDEVRIRQAVQRRGEVTKRCEVMARGTA